MYSGVAVVDGWWEIGMPRSTFYYLVRINPEAIANIQAVIDISSPGDIIYDQTVTVVETEYITYYLMVREACLIM